MTFIAIFCLLHYLYISVMNINVWRSIEKCKIVASIGQWHLDLKTYIFVKGGYFKHMTEINL